MHSFIKIVRSPGDWTLLPWIATYHDGWEFTWLFFGFGRVVELDFYDEEID